MGWAYTGVVLGGAVSIEANVDQSFVPPVGAPAGWRPMHGAVLGAVFWPVALFVVIEILARTRWPAGRSRRLIPLGGLLPVALVVAVVSYRHLSGLIRLLRGGRAHGDTRSPRGRRPDGRRVGGSPRRVVAAGHCRGRDIEFRRGRCRIRPDARGDISPQLRPRARRRQPEVGRLGQLPRRGPPRPQVGDARAFVQAELAAGRTPSGAAVGGRYDRNSRADSESSERS